MVIGAHPDDELLGAGGTLVRHVLAGDEVHAIVVADGARSRYPASSRPPWRSRRTARPRSSGSPALQLLSLPDQRLDTVPLIVLTQRLEGVLDEIDPSIVYTHFPEDVNADHGLVARCAWTACRPYCRCNRGLRTPSSTEWAWPMPGTELRPNLFVDVTDTLTTKIAAMECYETEFRDYPHPRSSRALRERAAYWGSHIGRLR